MRVSAALLGAASAAAAVHSMAWAAAASGPPLPSAKQLEWMELETIQFMHFSIPTAWKAPDAFLRRANPTFHNCIASWIPDHGYQTEGFYPCLNPKIFQPDELDVEQWMAAASSLNMKEICLTAKHAGGFTMWPSNFTPYGVQSATNWRGGKGDVLAEFVAAARRWNIKICYYINPMTDGYLANVANVSAAEFQRRSKGMMTEVLTKYGPVNRLWFDGLNMGVVQKDMQSPTVYKPYYDSMFELIRKVSPDTLISAYRGDVCTSVGSLYTNDGPPPNASDSSECLPASETGKYFHPTEMHGVTMQEGPDGNSPLRPTYWFWHDWACAGNVSGCPWVGHANASRIFDGYIATVGHGGVLNMNIAPDATGRLNASVVQVMAEAGKAINDTFYAAAQNAGAVQNVSGACADGVAVVMEVVGQFDYVVTMEDLTHGQRIGNYSIEFKRKGGDHWETLVPAVQPNTTSATATTGTTIIQQEEEEGALVKGAVGERDRPDGHDPRDQYIGHKRIDTPIVPTSGAGAIAVAQVRLNCHRLIAAVQPGEPVYVRSLSLHKRQVPWE